MFDTAKVAKSYRKAFWQTASSKSIHPIDHISTLLLQTDLFPRRDRRSSGARYPSLPLDFDVCCVCIPSDVRPKSASFQTASFLEYKTYIQTAYKKTYYWLVSSLDEPCQLNAYILLLQRYGSGCTKFAGPSRAVWQLYCKMVIRLQTFCCKYNLPSSNHTVPCR